MPKAKKVTSQKSKATANRTITKRTSPKRATSTPLSKSVMSVDIDDDTSIVAPIADVNVTKRKLLKGKHNASEIQSVVNKLSKPSAGKGRKRSGVPINSVMSESSPKKSKRKGSRTDVIAPLGNSNLETNGDISKTTRKGGRNAKKGGVTKTVAHAKAEKNSAKLKDLVGDAVVDEPTEIVAKGRKKKANTTDSIDVYTKPKRGGEKSKIIETSNDINTTRGKKRSPLLTKIQKAAKNKRKSTGIVATKVKRASIAKLATPKRGRRAK